MGVTIDKQTLPPGRPANEAFDRAFAHLVEHGAHQASVREFTVSGLAREFEHELWELAAALDVAEGFHLGTRFPAVLSFAVSSDLLALVEAYLDTPPALQGLHARRDVGPEVPEDLRCWHLDLEDERMIRVIIYLHDVDVHTGPFEFVPKPFTGACEHLRSRSVGDPRTNPAYEPVGDDEMRAVVPESRWVACVGPRLTAVLADTAGVFHRTKPHQRERRTLTVSYTSRSPRNAHLVRAPGLVSYLTPSQQACLYIYGEG